MEDRYHEYDAVVIITSFNRYGMLCRLLNSLIEQGSNIKIIVHDDASSEQKYKKLQTLYPAIKYIRTQKNNGKNGYWKTITTCLQAAKDITTKHVITMPDDAELCENFIEKVLDEHKKAKTKNNAIVCTSYGHISKDKQWDLTEWMDGFGVFDKDFIKQIDYRIDPISVRPKFLGSGVWEQISRKICRLGYCVHKPDDIFITHLGHTESVMHPELRKKQPLNITMTI